MKRRDFIGKAGLGIATGAVAASTLSAPAIAQIKKNNYNCIYLAKRFSWSWNISSKISC